MSMRLILCIICFVFISACKSNEGVSYRELGIKASFEVDDTAQLLDNNFTVSLEGATEKIGCRISHDTLFVPNNLEDSLYNVTFTYKDAALTFKGIYRSVLLPDQKFHWEFGIDNQPFNIVRGAASTEDLEPGKYSKIEFLMTNPQERGDGLLFRNKIK